jgi:hypothetical protein
VYPYAKAGTVAPRGTAPRDREVLTGMRPTDRKVLEVAMARLRLTDDELHLAGQFIFEPDLNPWLDAALSGAGPGRY